MKPSNLQTSGFSLVEVTLAMGIVAFSLVALMGLLTVGLEGNQAAMSQSAANGIFSAVISDLRAAPVTTPLGGIASSPQFQIPIPANPITAATSTTLYFTPDGQASPTIGTSYVYRLTVTFVPNGTSPRTATFTDLKLTWPAAAVPPNALGSVEDFVALDRN
jgi:uncharacterized protein (TIGR02598 family)